MQRYTINEHDNGIAMVYLRAPFPNLYSECTGGTGTVARVLPTGVGKYELWCLYGGRSDGGEKVRTWI